MSDTRPLAGIRVLDLTRLLPGAYATLLLASLGADVVKIEDPNGGDGMRRFGPRYFDAVNGGKRSVTLDLRSPDAGRILAALLATADVVVDSFRPATARRLHVDAATLRAAHPRLICASILGFSRDSPRAHEGAHDINYQSLAGTLRPPKRPGPLVGDIGAAMQTAIAVLAAIIERGRTGRGAALDVTIEDAARAWAQFPATEDLESACYTLYETADGEWLALGALEPKFWQAFCDRLGRSDFLPLQHARAFDAIRAVLRSKTRAEWLSIFDGADACLTPVVTPTAVPASASTPAPALGADTAAILSAAGIGDAEQMSLRAQRII